MHIPDGFLDPTISIITYLIFATFLVYTLRKIRNSFSTENVTLASVLAAGIFVAQMLNWPIPGGTSLHFVGGAFAGIVVGPWLGFLTMFVVLLIQCLIFHDGGITALGANTINMAVIAVFTGYIIYYYSMKIFGRKDSVRIISAFLGGWLSVTLAGLFCGIEIGFSPTFPYGLAITVPVMTIWHLILGIIEGAITMLAVLYLVRRQPQIIYSEVKI
ncbi:MAG: energy-coupling factor ABC transporter permease [Nitrososphaeria archaeon]